MPDFSQPAPWETAAAGGYPVRAAAARPMAEPDPMRPAVAARTAGSRIVSTMPGARFDAETVQPYTAAYTAPRPQHAVSNPPTAYGPDDGAALKPVREASGQPRKARIITTMGKKST